LHGSSELSREIKAAVEDVQDSLRDVSAGVKVINEHLIQMGDGIDGIKGELSGTRVDIHEVENSVRRFENGKILDLWERTGYILPEALSSLLNHSPRVASKEAAQAGDPPVGLASELCSKAERCLPH